MDMSIGVGGWFSR